MHSIFIHIGYPKTATTWLQGCVFPHLNGCAYLPFQDSRYGWFDSLLLDHDFVFNAAKIRTRFDASIASADTTSKMILSWESFAGNVFEGGHNALPLARRLHEVFPEASIIITVRNQVNMIESTYRQYIHEGGTLDINGFLSLRYPSPLRLEKEHFFYDRLVGAYQALFGKERVKVLVYEQLADDKHSFLSDLLGFIGVDEDVAAIEARCAARENIGMSLPSIYLARWLNRLVYSHFNLSPLLPRKLVSARHIRFALQRIADPLLLRRLKGKKSLLTDFQRAELSDYFRESNRRLEEISGVSLASYAYPL